MDMYKIAFTYRGKVLIRSLVVEDDESYHEKLSELTRQLPQGTQVTVIGREWLPGTVSDNQSRLISQSDIVDQIHSEFTPDTEIGFSPRYLHVMKLCGALWFDGDENGQVRDDEEIFYTTELRPDHPLFQQRLMWVTDQFAEAPDEYLIEASARVRKPQWVEDQEQ